nr:NUDIX domain-containing protein [Auraticoccus cholistanensis]
MVVVGAAFVDDLLRPTRVLAARRRNGDLAGGWEFPGGKVEPGEEPTDALLRELAEELGLGAVRLGGELGPPGKGWPLPNGAVLRIWWAVTDEALEPGPDHDAVRWLGAEGVLDVAWLPGDVPIAEELAGSWLHR